MYNLTMTNTRRQAGEKEGRESDEGMEEHALCSSKLSKRKKKKGHLTKRTRVRKFWL